MMFDTVKRLYEAGRLDETGLDKAVLLGWITAEQKHELMGSPTVLPLEPEQPTENVQPDVQA